jgi:hypothetical protein
MYVFLLCHFHENKQNVSYMRNVFPKYFLESGAVTHPLSLQEALAVLRKI